MTKAKTKSQRVWVTLDEDGAFHSVEIVRRRARHHAMVARTCMIHRRVVPATLTWTPPAKAKKRRAKR